MGMRPLGMDMMGLSQALGMHFGGIPPGESALACAGLVKGPSQVPGMHFGGIPPGEQPWHALGL